MNAPSFQLTVLLGPLPDVNDLSDPVVLVALLQNVLGFFPVSDMADFRFSSFAFLFWLVCTFKTSPSHILFGVLNDCPVSPLYVVLHDRQGIACMT